MKSREQWELNHEIGTNLIEAAAYHLGIMAIDGQIEMDFTPPEPSDPGPLGDPRSVVDGDTW